MLFDLGGQEFGWNWCFPRIGLPRLFRVWVLCLFDSICLGVNLVVCFVGLGRCLATLVNLDYVIVWVL